MWVCNNCVGVRSLYQVKDRTGSEPVQLQLLVKKLLIIVGRMARLLEIMVRMGGQDSLIVD